MQLDDGLSVHNYHIIGVVSYPLLGTGQTYEAETKNQKLRIRAWETAHKGSSFQLVELGHKKYDPDFRELLTLLDTLGPEHLLVTTNLGNFRGLWPENSPNNYQQNIMNTKSQKGFHLIVLDENPSQLK